MNGRSGILRGSGVPSPIPEAGRTARYTFHRIHKKDRHRRSAITDNSAWQAEKTGDS